jgi:hypothetical protein
LRRRSEDGVKVLGKKQNTAALTRSGISTVRNTAREVVSSAFFLQLIGHLFLPFIAPLHDPFDRLLFRVTSCVSKVLPRRCPTLELRLALVASKLAILVLRLFACFGCAFDNVKSAAACSSE